MRPLLRKSSAAKVVALSVQTAPPASMPLVVCWCRVVLLSACSLAAAVCSTSAIDGGRVHVDVQASSAGRLCGTSLAIPGGDLAVVLAVAVLLAGPHALHVRGPHRLPLGRGRARRPRKKSKRRAGDGSGGGEFPTNPN